MSLPGTGRPGVTSGTDPVSRPASPRTSAPPGRVRALPGGSRRGSRREPSCVAVGRRPDVHRRREARGGRGRPAGRWLGDRSVGRGHPGKGATGLGGLGVRGGRRPAAGCRGRACCCSAAVPIVRGTSSIRSPATGSAAPVRESLAPGRAPGHRESGPARSPTATSGTRQASRWPSSVQAVHPVLRRGRPLLRGGSAAVPASRPTTPDRGEEAPRRGKAPRAGSWGCWAVRAAPRVGRPSAAPGRRRDRPRPGAPRADRSPTWRPGGRGRGSVPAPGPPGQRGPRRQGAGATRGARRAVPHPTWRPGGPGRRAPEPEPAQAPAARGQPAARRELDGPSAPAGPSGGAPCGRRRSARRGGGVPTHAAAAHGAPERRRRHGRGRR